MKSYNTRKKKNYIEDKVDNPKKGRKKKNTSDENFEKQEMFLSERCAENNIYMFANEVIQNPIEKHIYSPKRPDKLNRKIINNKTIPIKRYSVQKERSSNKRRSVKSAIIQSNNDIIVQLEKNYPFSPNKRTNNKKKNEEYNINQEIKTKSQNNIPQKTQYKPQILPKGKSGRGRKPKNFNLNMNEITNKTNNNITEKNENEKKKRATRSCTTRDKKKKNENVTDNGTFKEEKTPRNKETKKYERKNKKNERKTRRKRGVKDSNKGVNRDKKRENIQIKKKSRSHLSNSNRDKEKEKQSKMIKQEIKIKRRDYSSPRIQHKQNYNDNTISVISNNINEELSNNLRNQPLSPPKNFNSLNMINNSLPENIHELKNDFFFTTPEVNLKKFTIIVKKNYYKDKNKKDIFVVNKISDEKNLGKKRKRSKTKKRKEKENSKKPNTRKNNNKDEIKEKNIRKGKSQKVIVDPDNIESSLTLEEVDKLKNDLICNKSKSNNIRGKKGTRKHKSMKKEEKKIKTEKIKEEDINSVDSFSEPDLDIKYDCFNHKNNTYRTNNAKNNQTIQYKYEEPSQNTPFERNSFQQNTPLTPELNNLNNNCNNFNNPSNKKSMFTNVNYNLSNTYRPFYDQYDLTVTKDNMLSSSMKDLGSETANFFEASSNNYEYSFPLDFEEKIDVKEDKTYYAKNSKYIKYHPIDKYLSPLSNEDKKPIRARIALPRTRKIDFSKKKENKQNKQNNHFDSDNDITDITSSNNDFSNYSNDLPSILNIPRIKPFREEHSKMIKDKLNQEGIKLYQTEDEKLQREEKNLYIGSFMLYDEKNNIKVTVPCYKDNSITKEFMNKKRLTVIEFQEDNDIDTDEEQLELEIQRNNNALLNFMKKVNKNKNYVDESLVRKRKQ